MSGKIGMKPIMWPNKLPRRKQRGIFGSYVSFAASGGEYNPKRFKENSEAVEKP
jgi:hypothetical protein